MGLSYKNRPVLLLNPMHRFQKNTHANMKMHNDIINQLRMRAAHMALDVLPQDLTVDSRPADNSQTDSPIGPVFKC
jgi:hypothetical protein